MIHQFIDRRLLDFTLWIERVRVKSDAASRKLRERRVDDEDPLGMDEILPRRAYVVREEKR